GRTPTGTRPSSTSSRSRPASDRYAGRSADGQEPSSRTGARGPTRRDPPRSGMVRTRPLCADWPWKARPLTPRLGGMTTAVRPDTAARRPTLRGRALPRRLVQLYLGLVLYGTSMALMVRSDLGVMPWDVLHQGLARHLGGSIGEWSMVVGALVLLGWVPLRERPGLGTVSNVVVIGV